jgi:hypothetical protein
LVQSQEPVLIAFLHHQGPVFDLICVPTVMHAKKVQSKEEGWCRPVATLRLAVLHPGQCSLRTTRHYNSKWPECNCAPAILSLTSCSLQTCNNTAPLGKQTCVPGVAKSHGLGSVCLKISSSFHLSSSCVQEPKQMVPFSNQDTA